MPYKLRKAPKRDLYWVVTIETGKKHSKEPIAFEKAQAQKRILEQQLVGGLSPAHLNLIYDSLSDTMTMRDAREAVRTVLELLTPNQREVLRKTFIQFDVLHIDVLKALEILEIDRPTTQEELASYNTELRKTITAMKEALNLYLPVIGIRNGAGSYAKGKASVFVITCIDPRYNYDVTHFLEKQKQLHKDYDLFVLAGASVGATKWSKAFFDNLALGIKLHGIKEVWCFDHLDCGMYKATFKLKKDDKSGIHIQCMDKLKNMIAKKHPSLGFKKFLVSAKGSVRMVK